MVDKKEIQPFAFQESTNIDEHQQIVDKTNEIITVINDTNLDAITARLDSDETDIKDNATSIAKLATGVKANSDGINALNSDVTDLTTQLGGLPDTITLYRNGAGKMVTQIERMDGTLIDSNTLDMVIPYQYDLISGTTERSFKMQVRFSDGSTATTNDFVIPSGGGTDVTVTGITLAKDTSDVNRFHVLINLSDSTQIDSGFISIVDSVSASITDNKLTIAVNGVESVPVALPEGAVYTAGEGITISDNVVNVNTTEIATVAVTDNLDTQIQECASGVTNAITQAQNGYQTASVSGSNLVLTKGNGQADSVALPGGGVTINTSDVNNASTLFTTCSALNIGDEFYFKCICNSTIATTIGGCIHAVIVSKTSSSIKAVGVGTVYYTESKANYLGPYPIANSSGAINPNLRLSSSSLNVDILYKGNGVTSQSFTTWSSGSITTVKH